MALPEVWLRGPLPTITPFLQPVAHALLQALEEVEAITSALSDDLLWEKPAGVASPGFHLKHMAGVLDRMCTYAKGQSLSEEQFAELKAEAETGNATVKELVARFRNRVNTTVAQLAETPEAVLTEFRPVGRKALPSTVLGLLFHAAEHTQRHVGQLLVTVSVAKR